MDRLTYKTSPKIVKRLIAKAMNDRKRRISVKLEDCDSQFDRIVIKYPKNLEDGTLSLNPITDILKKTNFYVAQILDWWDDNGKMTVLLCRGYKNEKN